MNHKLAEVSFGLDCSWEPTLFAIGSFWSHDIFSGRHTIWNRPKKFEPSIFRAAFWWYLGANACIGASLAGLPEQVARLGQKDSCSI
jgi:hypothetical protein